VKTKSLLLGIRTILLGCLLSSTLLFSLPLQAKESAWEELYQETGNYYLETAGVSDWQTYISTMGCSQPTSCEWIVFSLLTADEESVTDYSAYRQALEEYLSENQIASAPSRLKFALLLARLGSQSSFIQETLQDSIGQGGIMSLLFGLHLLNNGYQSDQWTKEQLTQQLLSYQTEDGGWAVIGQTADVDTTAMVIQALAPQYEEKEAVQTSIQRALQLLSQKQLSDGDFASYGVPNPESTAQVALALICLQRNPTEETLFQKNGNTLLDGIEKYRLSDGSFCHQTGGESNKLATEQVFLVAAAYRSMQSPYLSGQDFDTDKSAEGKTDAPTSSTISSETNAPITENSGAEVSGTEISGTEVSGAENSKAESSELKKQGTSYKVVICIVLIGIALLLCLFLFKKRKNPKKFLLQDCLPIFLLTGLLCLLIFATDLKSAEEYYGEEQESGEKTATLSIRCDTLIGEDSTYLPEDGIFLEEVELSFSEGESVFDLLLRATQLYQIQFDFSGTGSSVYVSGIGYLYEQEYGDLSGWMYQVNGEYPSIGCGSYLLSEGDHVVWRYTRNIGKDLD
jgi:hypothetical protein